MEQFGQVFAEGVLPAVFLLLACACWACVVFQLPGNWMMLLLAFLYGAAEGFHRMTWWVLAAGAACACAGELLEWATGWYGTRTFGGGRWAALWALAGSVAGGLLGAAFGWGLGAIPGTVLGAFAGALAAEAWRQRRMGGALKAGLGAAVGRALGLAAKLAFGGAFLSLLALRVLWVGLAG